MYEYKAELIRVIDGDTLELNIDLGFGIKFKERVRLAGINTPEIFSVKKESDEYKKGMEAKIFVENMLRSKDIVIQTEKDKKGKYGRYIATIIVGGDINLNERLVTENLAEKVDY
jgi:micrococcal nuclease